MKTMIIAMMVMMKMVANNIFTDAIIIVSLDAKDDDSNDVM